MWLDVIITILRRVYTIFNQFPTDPDRRRRWVSFVSQQNADGTLWKLGEGGRVCSEHFTLKKKSDFTW